MCACVSMCAYVCVCSSSTKTRRSTEVARLMSHPPTPSTPTSTHAEFPSVRKPRCGQGFCTSGKGEEHHHQGISTVMGDGKGGYLEGTRG